MAPLPTPTASSLFSLLDKLTDPDPDFRFMSLNDLLAILNTCKPDFLASYFAVSARCVDAVIKALDDTNGEVQNLAIRCLSPLSAKGSAHIVGPMLDKLCRLELKNSIDTAVPALALRTVVQSLPNPVPGVSPSKDVLLAYDAVYRILIPYLLGPIPNHVPLDSQAQPINFRGALRSSKSIIPDTVNLLIEIVVCFGPILGDNVVLVMQQAMTRLLDDEATTTAVKRRAVVALSVLAMHMSDPGLASMVNVIISTLADPNVTPAAQRNYFTIMGSMARSISARLGNWLPQLAPLVLVPLGEDELRKLRDQVEEGTAHLQEFNDVRESALVALEAFMSSCPTEMAAFTTNILDSALRYLKYDPNSAVDEDGSDQADDEQAGCSEGEDDFEDSDDEELDDDDTSWKVRRCAAKVISTLVNTRAHDLLENGILYQLAAPTLVKRFDERQETVRLEIIAAFAQLVRKSNDGRLDPSLDNFDLEAPSALSRKRRRQSSGVVVLESSAIITSPISDILPVSGPRADLDRLTPAVVKQCGKLLKGKLIPTKQAIIKLLDDIIYTQKSGVGDAFVAIMDLIVDTICSTGSGTVASALTTASGDASATPTTLRMAALKLVKDIAKTHPASILQPHLPNMVNVVVHAAADRFYKVAGEAILTAQELVKAITPPRSRANGATLKPELGKLYSTVMGRITANEADLEVRQQAIHALATILARTSSLDATWLSSENKTTGLTVLLDRLKNETTRLAAVRAIDAVVVSSGNLQFGSQWTHAVAIELAGQLRKVNRALKVSSIVALRHLLTTATTKSHLDKATIVQHIIPALLPGITQGDSQMLGPALMILASLALDHPTLVVNQDVMTVLCHLLTSSLASIALEHVLALVTNIGSSGHGQALMTVLLQDVSTKGDPNVVGKIIGALLVSSGSSLTVTVENFVTELERCAHTGAEGPLALSLVVLGETGMRLGQESPLRPHLFLEQFHKEPDKVSLAAATALGRAGSGNVDVFLPAILDAMGQGGITQHLSILAVKEILHSVTDLAHYAVPVWDHMLQASTDPESKVICAECVGRLVIMEPTVFMPRLQALLKDDSPAIRAMAAQAVRSSLAETDEQFDKVLRNVLVDILLLIIQDPDMEIRRLAMTTLNSAVHNKPDFLLPSLPALMPFVIRETIINKSLIREVKLGPFTHIVDDGLELRKSAYDTLYALMESAFSRIPVQEFYDRVISGLSDDNDIRSLCNLMISKLINLRPDEIMARLDVIAENFRKTLSTKLKENAVKQELEKQDEASKGALRVTLILADRLKVMLPGLASVAISQSAAGPVFPVWNQYWDWVQKEFEPQLKLLLEESQSLQIVSM